MAIAKPVPLKEAAELVGLAPSTLKTYTQAGRSSLIRGTDFYVHRFGPFRRKLYFTPHGIWRLQNKAYQCFTESLTRLALPSPAESYGLPPRYDGASGEERRQRLKQTVVLVIRDYLKHPCAVPNCPCMTHRLGLPQADVIIDMLTPRPRKRGWEK